MRLIELFERASVEKKTLYCCRKLKNADEIIKWAKGQGFESCLEPDDFHVTIAYSKKEIDQSELEEQDDDLTVKATDEGRSVEEFNGGAVVLRFQSDELEDRWREIKDDFGASYDFPEYKPHVTITYDGIPEGMKLEDIEPYDGKLEFGPEEMSEVNTDWKASVKEKKLDESFNFHDVKDLNHFYDIFRKSYEAETGKAWSKEKLFDRAQDWTFYGDDNGFVAVRKQASGMKKLVAVAGDPRSILKGLDELQAEGGAIWGAVSKPLAMMAKKRGMIVPNLLPGGALFIRTTIPLVPASVFGGHQPEVTKDGGIVIDYPDVGRVEKYLVGNKAYFKAAAAQPHIADALKKVPGVKQFMAMIGLHG